MNQHSNNGRFLWDQKRFACLFIAVFLGAVTVLFSSFGGEAQAAPPPPYFINTTDGGDCNLIGTWNGATNTCTLDQDVILATEGVAATPNLIEIQDDGITIDGAGHTIKGINNTGTGIDDTGAYDNLSVANVNFDDLYYGVDLFNSTGHFIEYSTFSKSLYGIFIYVCTSVEVDHSEFGGNDHNDILIQDSSLNSIKRNDFFDAGNLSLNNADNNIFFNNNFLDATGTDTINVTDATSTGNIYDDAVFGGNYWETYARPIQNCFNNDHDEFCDDPYTYTPSAANDPIDNQPLARRQAWFSWYDSFSPGAHNWVLLANPDDPYHMDLWYDLFIEDVQKILPLVPGKYQGEVPPLEAVTPKYDGVIGGPVEVGYHGSWALASQRTLWAVNSLEEVMATDFANLSDYYHWPWYDQFSPGYKNWVLVSNPNNIDIYYEVRIGGVIYPSTNGKPEQGVLGPGESMEPMFDGIIGGPVQVQAWYDAIHTLPAPAIASQRVLSNGDTAFNEVPGIPDEQISDHYIWPWYDETSPGATDWILIANPPAIGGIHYEIWIGGVKVCDDGAHAGTIGCAQNIDATPVPAGLIPPGGFITPRFNLQDGPVEVKTFLDVPHTLGARSIATQRITWGPSFEEVPGIPETSVVRTYYWTWYDQLTPGMINWVVVSNLPTAAPVDFSISIAGTTMDLDPITGGKQEQSTVNAGEVKAFTFPGTIGGPVVVSADNSVIATQRVLHNGFLNEVLGTAAP